MRWRLRAQPSPGGARMSSGYTQEMTGVGWIGAVLFVAIPSVGGYWWSGAIGKATYWARLGIADRAQDALPSPLFMAVLLAVWLVGCVMLLVGRDLAPRS